MRYDDLCSCVCVYVYVCVYIRARAQMKCAHPHTHAHTYTRLYASVSHAQTCVYTCTLPYTDIYHSPPCSDFCSHSFFFFFLFSFFFSQRASTKDPHICKGDCNRFGFCFCFDEEQNLARPKAITVPYIYALQPHTTSSRTLCKGYYPCQYVSLRPRTPVYWLTQRLSPLSACVALCLSTCHSSSITNMRAFVTHACECL